jgi:hypothetical protein
MHFPFSFCVRDVRLQDCDIFIITFFSLHDLCGLYYKCFTIVIYNCNDSAQYYKNTIVVKDS